MSIHSPPEIRSTRLNDCVVQFKKDAQPVEIFRKDYSPLALIIPQLSMTFDIHEGKTTVTSRLSVADTSEWWVDEEEYVRKYVRASRRSMKDHGGANSTKNIGVTEMEEEAIVTNAHLAELHTLLTSTVMIRRKKADILKTLPNKIRECVRVTLRDETLAKRIMLCMRMLREGKGMLGKLYRKHFPAKPHKNNHAELEYRKAKVKTYIHGTTTVTSGDNRDTKNEGVVTHKTVLQKLLLLTGQAKVPIIVDMLKRWIDDPTKGKLCVFAHHVSVLDAIIAGVGMSKREDRTKYIRIDGSTLPKSRQERIARFQTDPTVKIAILGITAAGVAVTLTAASTLWFAELFWTPAIMIQAEDRCHRIGQQARVRCMYVIGKRTLDEVLWKLIEKKFRDLGEFVEGKEKLDMVVHQTYDNELLAMHSTYMRGDNVTSNGEEETAANNAKDVPTETNISDLADTDTVRHDIEELAKEEQAVLTRQTNREDDKNNTADNESQTMGAGASSASSSWIPAEVGPTAVSSTHSVIYLSADEIELPVGPKSEPEQKPIDKTACILTDSITATDSKYECVEGVMGHENFHNWTGNHVTCREWFQLTLKEGLTVLRDEEFSGVMGSNAIKRMEKVRGLEASQFMEDTGPRVHHSRPKSYINMDNFYTAMV